MHNPDPMYYFEQSGKITLDGRRKVIWKKKKKKKQGFKVQECKFLNWNLTWKITMKCAMGPFVTND